MASDGRKFSEFEQLAALGDTIRFAVYDPTEGIEFDQNKTVASTVLDLRYRKNDSVVRISTATISITTPGKYIYSGGSNASWTLPLGASTNAGREFTIINDSPDEDIKITLLFTSGQTLSPKLSNEIYGTIRLFWDGTYWQY